ncbi:MAG: tetratricopeptide repeat protein [Planctomycetes bacterium]|nr:tetratricopeptide repeat protein [Planctomycetota bacterium]
MTTTTKNPAPTTPSAVSPRSGFQPIPTRIRDVRDGQVPPLVVTPIAEQQQAAIRQSLDELGGKLAEIHRTAGEAYLSQGLYAQSLPHLEAAATFAPGEADYQLQLGFVRYLGGDDVGAINSFNAVLARDPNNGDAWFDLGMVLFGQGQPAEAEDCFRHACELPGCDAQVWNNRGVCQWKLGRQAEAKQCFHKALQLDPNDADARFNLQSLA